MSNQHETAQTVKSAITEADVAAYLKQLVSAHGLSNVIVCLSPFSATGVSWMVEHKSVDSYRSGHTSAEAIEKLKASIKTPEQIAQKKRDQAALLLAEADALADGKAVAA